MKPKYLKFGIATGAALILSGCSMFQTQSTPIRIESAREVDATENPVPGTVTGSWAEPMVDTVRVPAQLDPTGTYYRPSHRTVVEIRDGRYQEAQYPPDGN